MEAQILCFGQTAQQLLSRPHPPRRPRAAAVPSSIFARPEAVKAYGPFLRGGGGGGGGGAADPVVFVHSVTHEDSNPQSWPSPWLYPNPLPLPLPLPYPFPTPSRNPSPSPNPDSNPSHNQVPDAERLVTVLASGRVLLHRWQALKPDGGGAPFSFEPTKVTHATLPATPNQP